MSVHLSALWVSPMHGKEESHGDVHLFRTRSSYASQNPTVVQDTVHQEPILLFISANVQSDADSEKDRTYAVLLWGQMVKLRLLPVFCCLPQLCKGFSFCGAFADIKAMPHNDKGERVTVWGGFWFSTLPVTVDWEPPIFVRSVMTPVLVLPPDICSKFLTFSEIWRLRYSFQDTLVILSLLQK